MNLWEALWRALRGKPVRLRVADVRVIEIDREDGRYAAVLEIDDYHGEPRRMLVHAGCSLSIGTTLYAGRRPPAKHDEA